MKTLSDIMALSDAEVNEQLAKVVDWKPLPPPFGCDMAGNRFEGFETPPSYTSSLDAQQQIKEGLDYTQQVKFAKALYAMRPSCIIYDSEGQVWDEVAILISSDAKLQARALLAALTEKLL